MALAYMPLIEIGHDSSRPPPSSKGGWRIIPQIDKDRRVVAYAQTLPGRAALFATMVALAASCHLMGVDLDVAPLAMLFAYTRKLRVYILPMATLALLYRHGFWVDVDLIHHVIEQEGLANRVKQPLLIYGMSAFVVVLFSCLLATWPRMAAIKLFRRSTLCLISLVVALVIATQLPITVGLPRVLLWSFLAVSLPYFWFLAYALSDIATLRRTPVWRHLGVFHPFWGSTMTPFGKGLAYLAKFEAKTPEDLAVTQLKGLKLACWAFLLAVCLIIFDSLSHGIFVLPKFDDLFSGYLTGTRYPRYLCWISLLAYFLEDLLNIAIWGGAIIACARMAGFRLLRNTYRPLEATTPC